MAKKLSGMPKALHAGRTVALGGKQWTVQESYSERLYGSTKTRRTILLVLTE